MKKLFCLLIAALLALLALTPALAEADAAQPLRPKPDENSAVAWLPLDQAAENREEPFMAVVYRKLNGKLCGY